MSLGNLGGRFEGESIYIIGSSARIDELPDDFCKGKLSIGLNESFLRFQGVGPLPTFIHVCEKAVYDWINSGDKPVNDRLLPTSPLYPEVEPINRPSIPFRPGRFNSIAALEGVDRALEGDTGYRYTAYGTCLHTAVYLAILLGASRIYTAGCGDAEMYCAAVTVMKHITQQVPPERMAGQRNRQKRGTEILKAACKLRGILWEEV